MNNPPPSFQEQPKERLVLAVKLLHIGILIFVVFGCLLPVRALLLIHLIFVPLVIVQWQLNQGRCILTDLESRLRNERPPDQSDGFVKKLLAKYLGVSLTKWQLTALMYAVMSLSFFVSLGRLVT